MPTADSPSPAIVNTVVDTSLEVLGNAPAESIAIVYQALAHSIGLSMQSAQANNTGLMSIGSAVTSVGANKILKNI